MIHSLVEYDWQVGYKKHISVQGKAWRRLCPLPFGNIVVFTEGCDQGHAFLFWGKAKKEHKTQIYILLKPLLPYSSG